MFVTNHLQEDAANDYSNIFCDTILLFSSMEFELL